MGSGLARPVKRHACCTVPLSPISASVELRRAGRGVIRAAASHSLQEVRARALDVLRVVIHLAKERAALLVGVLMGVDVGSHTSARLASRSCERRRTCRYCPRPRGTVTRAAPRSPFSCPPYHRADSAVRAQLRIVRRR